mmetsp:Transcript_31655/g.89922  ORF Transcript_31655/g.89922 Transcript_31655/m.89922 type:complete len:219 (-) Transcript_31655:1785-2441(-)
MARWQVSGSWRTITPVDRAGQAPASGRSYESQMVRRMAKHLRISIPSDTATIEACPLSRDDDVAAGATDRGSEYLDSYTSRWVRHIHSHPSDTLNPGTGGWSISRHHRNSSSAAFDHFRRSTGSPYTSSQSTSSPSRIHRSEAYRTSAWLLPLQRCLSGLYPAGIVGLTSSPQFPPRGSAHEGSKGGLQPDELATVACRDLSHHKGAPTDTDRPQRAG